MIPKEALFSKVREMAASPISWTKIEPYMLPLVVVLVGVGAFGLGRLSLDAGGSPQLRVLYPNAAAATPVANMAAVAAQAAPLSGAAGQEPGSYVASKSGAKYYLTGCSGASRIKQENRVYFASAQEARAAGYEPAANCPGL
jgi:hypothetical protein